MIRFLRVKNWCQKKWVNLPQQHTNGGQTLKHSVVIVVTGCPHLSADITLKVVADVWSVHREWAGGLAGPGRRCQRSEVLPLHHRQELPPPGPPALLLAQKRSSKKGQSILCWLPRYLPFLLAKIPHWPPVRFPPSLLDTVALLQMRFKLRLCVVHYHKGTVACFLPVFKQPLSPSVYCWDTYLLLSIAPWKIDELPLMEHSYCVLFSLASSPRCLYSPCALCSLYFPQYDTVFIQGLGQWLHATIAI